MIAINDQVFRRPGVISDWDAAFSVECWSRGPIEDMPSVGFAPRPIVSERMRRWLEHAPGHAQFLPVTLRHRGKALRVPPYWVANWLQEIECHEPKITEWHEERDANGEAMIGMLGLNPRKVPSGAKIFMVRYSRGETLIRDDLKALLEASGMRGPHFCSVRQTGDPWPPPEGEEGSSRF